MTTGFEQNNGFDEIRTGLARVTIPVRRQRGFVLILMTFALIMLIGAVGLAVDMGRVFIAKNESQAYADAEALAAALQLNGKETGITNAINTVTSSTATYNFSSTDKWNLNNCSFLSSTSGCSRSAPVVEVSTAATGATWYTSAGAVPSGTVPTIKYVRVTTSVNLPIYFMPVLRGVGTSFTQTVAARAIAGQEDIRNFTQGLAPFTGVAQNTTGPYFGLTVGGVYDIQWPQFNATRQQCNNGNPENCFVQNPCPNDQVKSVEQSVTQFWGSSTNGYWGATGTSVLDAYIIGTQQLAAIPIPTGCPGDLTLCFNMTAVNSCGINSGCMSNGNKQATANYLDQRVNSDPSHLTNDLATYLSDNTRNGLRFITVPLVYPTQVSSVNQTPAVGYGKFMLLTTATSSKASDYYQSGGLYGYKGTGGDPYCAIYAGPFNLGSIDPGAEGGTGASRVKLVL